MIRERCRVNSVFSGCKVAVSAFFLSLVTLSSPVLANSSAADMTAPVKDAARDSKASPLGSSDDNFRSLFADMRSLETEQQGQGAVSIPSRMPVEGVRLSSNYGMRTHPVTGGRRAHKGVDLAGPVGTPIYATADGVVSRADWFSSYGLYISIEHGGAIQTRYGHLSRLNVAANQRVKKGDLIGYMGSTGRSTGPHLHYEVRLAGEAVNPIPYMQADDMMLAATAKGSATGQGGPE